MVKDSLNRELRVVDAARRLGRDVSETLWCIECGRHLPNLATGKAHYRQYHKNDYPYYCEVCSHGYVHYDAAVRHIRRDHHASTCQAKEMVIVMDVGE